MIKRKNLWYLTLFSIIFALCVYYITIPNDLFTTIESDNNSEIVGTIEEVSSLVAMRVNLQEERQEEMSVLQEQLVSGASSDEKNNAYEKLKYLNEIQSLEEKNELNIKNELGLDCFVKIDNSDVNAVCISDSHDVNLANKIMRLIQSSFKDKRNITVKFQKN